MYKKKLLSTLHYVDLKIWFALQIFSLIWLLKKRPQINFSGQNYSVEDYSYYFLFIHCCGYINIDVLTYENLPIQVYSKRWKSIWHILWYSKAIFESLQWKVRHSHCSHFWSVIPNGSQHMQKWTHSALLVITETSKSICNFACPHNCPPMGNDDRTVPHNYHK